MSASEKMKFYTTFVNNAVEETTEQINKLLKEKYTDILK